MIKRFLQEPTISEAYSQKDVWLGYGYNYILDKWFASHDANETVQWNPPWFLGTPDIPQVGHCIVMVGLKPHHDTIKTRNELLWKVASSSFGRWRHKGGRKIILKKIFMEKTFCGKETSLEKNAMEKNVDKK